MDPLAIDGFNMSEISAEEAQQILGPDVDLEAPVGSRATTQRFTYYKGDDTVERRDLQAGVEAVFHDNGAGYWSETEINLFDATVLTADEAQQLLGPDADLTAETVQRLPRRSLWRRWAAALGLAR
jgi:hypothetical protein